MIEKLEANRDYQNEQSLKNLEKVDATLLQKQLSDVDDFRQEFDKIIDSKKSDLTKDQINFLDNLKSEFKSDIGECQKQWISYFLDIVKNIDIMFTNTEVKNELLKIYFDEMGKKEFKNFQFMNIGDSFDWDISKFIKDYTKEFDLSTIWYLPFTEQEFWTVSSLLLSVDDPKDRIAIIKTISEQKFIDVDIVNKLSDYAFDNTDFNIKNWNNSINKANEEKNNQNKKQSDAKTIEIDENMAQTLKSILDNIDSRMTMSTGEINASKIHNFIARLQVGNSKFLFDLVNTYLDSNSRLKKYNIEMYIIFRGSWLIEESKFENVSQENFESKKQEYYNAMWQDIKKDIFPKDVFNSMSAKYSITSLSIDY